MSHAQITPLAYGLDELPFGRTLAYRELKAGRLSAVKIGRRTCITADELKRYLAARPAYVPARRV